MPVLFLRLKTDFPAFDGESTHELPQGAQNLRIETDTDPCRRGVGSFLYAATNCRVRALLFPIWTQGVICRHPL